MIWWKRLLLNLGGREKSSNLVTKDSEKFLKEPRAFNRQEELKLNKKNGERENGTHKP